MLRLYKSLVTLGLTVDEAANVMRQCDYWDAMGQPYPQYRAKAAA
jgi:hypothetical protein